VLLDLHSLGSPSPGFARKRSVRRCKKGLVRTANRLGSWELRCGSVVFGREGMESRLPDIRAQVVALGSMRSDVAYRAELIKFSSEPANGCGIPCGAPQDSTSCRRIDTSNRHDARSAGAGFRTTRGPAARERLWGETFSRRLFTQVFEENLLLFAGQELVVT
jgi:hypothetical protein